MSSQVAIRTPSPITIALRAKLANFIQASYGFLQKQDKKDVGTLATPEVLEVVKSYSTAFHCNSAGNVDMLWIRKDIPLEALLDHETAYWTSRAGPASQHEQLELVDVHDVPQEAMDLIRSSKDQNLIAHYLFPFIDFWNLCEYHILIIIACIIFSGSICIIQPTLLVVESSKITRVLFDDFLVRVFVQGILEDLFNIFLTGNFEQEFLATICVFTVIVIIWKEMPLSPEAWLHCYGIPVVVNYGPLPQHCAIAIPKQHPYRPFHSPSISREYVELDRCARLIIELARDIISQVPPPPVDSTRRAYLVQLRLIIINKAVELGYYKRLEAEKAKVRRRQQAFFTSKSVATEQQIRKASGETSATRLEERIAGGKNAAKRRAEIATRAVGDKGSQERIAWVAEKMNELRRDLESGKTLNLLACPSNMLHGTLEQCTWLIHQVNKDADLVNSASGSTQLATPKTELEKEARAALQDAAGAAHMQLNISQVTVEEALQKLSNDVLQGSQDKRPIELAKCSHCKQEWLIHDRAKRSTHTCVEMRKWILPLLFEDLQQRKLQQQQDAEKQEEALEEDVPPSLGVSRASYTGVFGWAVGEKVEDDKTAWAAVCANKAVRTVRETRNPTLSHPLWLRCMDRAGRLSRWCWSQTSVSTTGQLLALPIAADLFNEDKTPKEVDGVDFVKLPDALTEFKEELIEAGIKPEKIEEAEKNGVNSYVAVSKAKKPEDRKHFLILQVLDHLKQTRLPFKSAEVNRDQIQAGYMERLALRNLRPANFDWSTGEDLMFKSTSTAKDEEETTAKLEQLTTST